MIFRNVTIIFVMTMVFVLTIIGCVESKPQTKAAAPMVKTISGQAPRTLAILPFENNSVTDPANYDPLSKGLAAMLITDLQNNVSALKVIERQKIQGILKEIALSQSGAVEQSTALRAGRVLGAQAIAIGSFMVLGKQVRIDTRIIAVETSEIIMADSIVGGRDAFIDLEQKLAKKIAGAFNITLPLSKTQGSGNINAALLFSRGLEELDKGNSNEADALFQQAVVMDPAYRTRVENLKGRP